MALARSGNEYEDFVGDLLRLYTTQPNHLCRGDLFQSCMTNIAARSDTTSMSLTSVLYHLIRTPEALRKVSPRTSPSFSLLP